MCGGAYSPRRRDDNPTRTAWIPNRVFLQLIERIRRTANEPLQVHVFSNESNEEGWRDFEDIGCTLHLRRDHSSNPLLTEEKIDWRHFIAADILVVGGTFSYVPALLSNHTVYFPESFWHPRLSEWIKYSEAS
jgi:hypothetical protein